MYEKLVNRLNICAYGGVKDCKGCKGCEYLGGDSDMYCFCKLIAEAADAIESMHEMVATAYEENANIIQSYEDSKPRWIPVTERFPEEDVAVLTWGKQAVVLIDWHRNGKWFVAEGVTHWMPLPDPPKEVSNCDA